MSIPQTPPSGAPTNAPEPFVNKSCYLLEELDNGEAEFIVRIPPEIYRRLKTRAQTQPIDEYLWENVLKRALETHVY